VQRFAVFGIESLESEAAEAAAAGTGAAVLDGDRTCPSCFPDCSAIVAAIPRSTRRQHSSGVASSARHTSGQGIYCVTLSPAAETCADVDRRTTSTAWVYLQLSSSCTPAGRLFRGTSLPPRPPLPPNRPLPPAAIHPFFALDTPLKPPRGEWQ
jgi:hypothetical protein